LGALIFRLLTFLGAILLTADALLPARSELVHVDGHHTTENRTSTSHHGVHRTTDYILSFGGGRVSSCAVGYTAYNALHDGDEVVVATSRVFKGCDRIVHEGEVITTGRHWGALLVAAGLFAVAFGWISSNRDDDDDVPLRRGRWWLKY
jgi:hypothetical protein